jgi:hypothetical protein
MKEDVNEGGREIGELSCARKSHAELEEMSREHL